MNYKKVAILFILSIITIGCIETANNTGTTDISQNNIDASSEIENTTTTSSETESHLEIILQKPPTGVIGGE